MSTRTADIKRPVIIRPQVTVHCRECEMEGDKPLRAGVIQNGQFVFEVRHHGKTHVQRIDVQYLLRLLAA